MHSKTRVGVCRYFIFQICAFAFELRQTYKRKIMYVVYLYRLPKVIYSMELENIQQKIC